MHIGVLYPQPPYAFDKLLGFLRRHAHPTLDIAYQEAYWRALRFDTGIALVRVSSSGSVESPALEVDLIGQVGVVVEPQALHNRLKGILDGSTPRDAFFELARNDELLWQVVQPVYGLPVLRAPTWFEALVITIIEQHISWIAAQRALLWLLRWADNHIAYQDRIFYAFPSAAQIAGADPVELKPLKITDRRISVLIDIAQEIQSGRLNLESFGDQEPQAAYRSLLSIYGVGHWTAVVTMDRAFRHSQLVADNDVALQAAVNRYFFNTEGRAAPQTVQGVFSRYGRYAGLAAFYTLARWVFDQYPQVEY
jgi:3-methyladenine DNA glycosylase/8-oxoguanine DNA glycosylase